MNKKNLIISLATVSAIIGLTIAIAVPVVLITKNETKKISLDQYFKNPAVAKIQIQDLINASGPYADVMDAQTVLNNQSNINYIKSLLQNDNTISKLNITTNGSAGANSQEMNLNIMISITYMDGHIGPNGNSVNEVEVNEFKASIGQRIQWTNLATAKTQIEALVAAGGTYNSIDAISQKLNETTSKNNIINLINNKQGINDIDAKVVWNRLNGFILTFDVVYNEGFTGPGTLEPIFGLQATVTVVNNWNNSTNAQATIQRLIDSKGINQDVATIKDELNNSHEIITGLISDNNTIKSINVEVVETANDTYKTTIAITYFDGFNGVASLELEQLKKTSLASQINWTNAQTVKTFFDTQFDSTVNSIATLETKINQDSIKTQILANINNNQIIQNISVTINGSNPAQLTILLTATYKPGYISSLGESTENLRLLGTNGNDQIFTGKIIAKVPQWAPNAKWIIENIISEIGPLEVTQAIPKITEALNTENNLHTIFEQFVGHDDSILAATNVVVSGDGSPLFNISVTYQLKDGFVSANGSKTAVLRKLNLRGNILVEPVWLSYAQENIQILINNDTYVDFEAVGVYLKSIEQQIKEHINVDQSAVKSIVTWVTSSGSNEVTLHTSIKLNSGFVLANLGDSLTLDDLVFTFQQA